MSYAKGIIILAVLALSALSQQVASEELLSEICTALKATINTKTWNENPKAIIKRARKYRFFIWPKSRREAFDNLIEAMDAIVNEKECSDKSLDYLLTIPECSEVHERIEEASKVYKNKCLSAQLANQMIMSAFEGRTVDILSPDSIKAKNRWDYWPEYAGPSVVKLMKDSRAMHAIYEGFKTEGRKSVDAMSEGEPSAALVSYLNEKLFEPCTRYIEPAKPFIEKLRRAAYLYEQRGFDSGFTKLVQTLDQEAKDAIFRFIYCEGLVSEEETVVKDLAKKLINSP